MFESWSTSVCELNHWMGKISAIEINSQDISMARIFFLVFLLITRGIFHSPRLERLVWVDNSANDKDPTDIPGPTFLKCWNVSQWLQTQQRRGGIHVIYTKTKAGKLDQLCWLSCHRSLVLVSEFPSSCSHFQIPTVKDVELSFFTLSQMPQHGSGLGSDGKAVLSDSPTPLCKCQDLSAVWITGETLGSCWRR